MNYNNRGNRQVYGTGCSMFGCLMVLLFLGFVVRGSIFFFFRYFWLILILGAVVWVFRKFVDSDNSDEDASRDQQENSKQDWHRDFENRKNTSFHNIDRDFEEIDDEEDDDEFKDF